MNIIKWIKQSDRWKHILGGLALGILSLANWYTAVILGIVTSSTLEFKDKSWGGKWDWIDWILTVLGTAVGYFLCLIFKYFVL